MIQLVKYLHRAKPFQFILLGVVLIYSISVLSFSFSKDILEVPFADEHIVVLFFFGVIIGPFLETMLFQVLPLKITRRFFKHKNKLFVYLVFSAATFMLLHPLNMAYMVFSFIAGVVLALFLRSA